MKRVFIYESINGKYYDVLKHQRKFINMCKDIGHRYHSNEVYRIDDFANYFKISKSTIYNWIKKGKLIPAKHYIKIERSIRFIITKDLIFELDESNQKKKSKKIRKEKKLPRKINFNR